jgi:CDP-diglyceride synthetase
MQNAYLASDVLPAIAFWVVALLAVAPAFSIMRQGRRGRARSAIAYLAGFFTGLIASVCISLVLAMLMETPPQTFNAGVAAAFLGPFTGIVHAKLKRAARRRSTLAEA